MGKLLSQHMRATKVQASQRIRAVSPEPMLFAHLNGRARVNFSQRTQQFDSNTTICCKVKKKNTFACIFEIVYTCTCIDTQNRSRQHLSFVVKESVCHCSFIVSFGKVTKILIPGNFLS